MSIRLNVCKKFIAIITIAALLISVLPAPVTYAETNISLTAKYTEEGDVRLNWTLVDGGRWYKVYRASQVEGKAGTYKLLFTSTCEPGDEDWWQTSYEDYTTKSGKSYYYKVVVLDKEEKKIAETQPLKYSRKLEKPSIDRSYTDITTGDPVIKWDKVSGADEYKVYRSTKKSGTYKLRKTTTKRTYTDSKATSGKIYYYKVKAVSEDDKAVNSTYSSVCKIKAVKADKKFASAVKNTKKKKISTLKNTMSIISKTDVRKLTGFDGGLLLFIDGKMKLSQVYDFKKITKAGGTLVQAPFGGRGDPFMTAIVVQPKKNGAKYNPIEIESNGLNIHKVKKGSTQKQTIKSIKETVREYYPSSKWTVTVEKYSAKKHKGEIKDLIDSYNYYLDKSSYKKYKSNKYVLKIKNKANSKKQGWAFVTTVPTL